MTAWSHPRTARSTTSPGRPGPPIGLRSAAGSPPASSGCWPTIRRCADRAVEVMRGEGGDMALVIDCAAEDVIFAELDALHAAGHRFTAVSEERGEVDYGGVGPAGLRVVIDPIDGSTNAKRCMTHHSVSIAVADGADDGRRLLRLRLRLRRPRGVDRRPRRRRHAERRRPAGRRRPNGGRPKAGSSCSRSSPSTPAGSPTAPPACSTRPTACGRSGRSRSRSARSPAAASTGC